MPESLSALAIDAANRAKQERDRRWEASKARAERERRERAERHYREVVEPKLGDILGTDPADWEIVQYRTVLGDLSMTVRHREDQDLALVVFGPGHVRLAYQGDDGMWHAWDSGPLIRSLEDLGQALLDWSRRHQRQEVSADG